GRSAPGRTTGAGLSGYRGAGSLRRPGRAVHARGRFRFPAVLAGVQPRSRRRRARRRGAMDRGRQRYNEIGVRMKKSLATERKFTTISGVPVEPLYGPEQLRGFDPARDLAEPGEFPY